MFPVVHFLFTDNCSVFIANNASGVNLPEKCNFTSRLQSSNKRGNGECFKKRKIVLLCKTNAFIIKRSQKCKGILIFTYICICKQCIKHLLVLGSRNHLHCDTCIFFARMHWFLLTLDRYEWYFMLSLFPFLLIYIYVYIYIYMTFKDRKRTFEGLLKSFIHYFFSIQKFKQSECKISIVTKVNKNQCIRARKYATSQ